MFHIACLHTADSNIDVFGSAAAGLPVVLHHVVRADLLAAAEARGGMDAAIASQVRAELDRLARDVAAVILTCSTLGPAVAGTGDGPCPVFRADAALARLVALATPPATVLCAAPTSLDATTDLFHAAAGPGPKPQVRLVTGAWALFRAGETDACHRAIAAAADAAYATGARTVALAQTSMAGAAALAVRGRPLTVPRAALLAVPGVGAR